MEDITLGMGLELRPTAVKSSAAVASAPAAPERGPARGRILISYDDPRVCETLRRQLAVLGFGTAVFASEQEAITAYARARSDGQPFGAVILGVRADDGWGGMRTLAELRSLDPQVKAIIWSDWLPPVLRACARQGYCSVLDKPHALAELRLKLEALLPA